MSTSRQSIMTFVTRSRPFCRPKEQTRKPATTTTSAQSAISPGEESIAPKALATSSVLMPEWNAPVRNLPK